MERKDWYEKIIIPEDRLEELIKSVNLKEKDINPYGKNYEGWPDKAIRIDHLIDHVKDCLNHDSSPPPVNPLDSHDLDPDIKELIRFKNLVTDYEDARDHNNHFEQNVAKTHLNSIVAAFKKEYITD